MASYLPPQLVQLPVNGWRLQLFLCRVPCLLGLIKLSDPNTITSRTKVLHYWCGRPHFLQNAPSTGAPQDEQKPIGAGL
jgi:hypothetical protein